MENSIDWFAYEREAQGQGFLQICGIDEAGRGPLAGPVYAAAVILPFGLEIEGLNDSKKLSEKKRERLFDEICAKASAWAVASADVEEIERLNILGATFLAMSRAVEGLKLPSDYALVDGDKLPVLLDIPARAVVKGDSLSASIAAASILAKVSRDRYMLKLAEEYPDYAFEKHKGYGTKLHVERIRQYGPCDIHRSLFLRKILGKPS